MKRATAIGLFLAMLVISSGCVSVIGNRGEFRPARQAVVIDDQIYVVDVYKGAVKKIDRNDIFNAPKFEKPKEKND